MRIAIIVLLSTGLALAILCIIAIRYRSELTVQTPESPATEVRLPDPQPVSAVTSKKEPVKITSLRGAPLGLHLPAGADHIKPLWLWLLQGGIIAFISFLVIRQKAATDRRENQLRELKMKKVTEELIEKKEQLARSLYDQENTIAELNIAFLNLASSNAFKSRLLGMLGHDMLTPIQYMGRVSAQIKNNMEKLSQQTIVDSLGEISNTAVQLQLFGESLVQWVKLQAEGYSPVITDIHLPELVNEVTNLYQLPITEKRNTVIPEMQENLLFQHDRTVLKIMLLNLIGNANKFTSQGKMQIKMEIDGTGALVLTVIDNGVGMSRDKVYWLNNLRPTFSSHGTGMEKGFGLGYVLIIDLLKMTNGKMNVTSLQGSGTQVMIRLPKAVIQPAISNFVHRR
jgi:signal transduction histidine kinase